MIKYRVQYGTSTHYDWYLNSNDILIIDGQTGGIFETKNINMAYKYCENFNKYHNGTYIGEVCEYNNGT